MAKKLHLVHVKSRVPDKAPSAETLNYGEIAVNYNVDSPALYIKDDEDNIVKFGPERGNAKIFYGECSSPASATTKTVVCTAFTSEDLVEGAIVYVKFTNTSSAAVSSTTLDVNSTGAYNVKKIKNGSGLSNLDYAAELTAHMTQAFTFTGSYWAILGVDKDSNTDTIGYSIRTNGAIPVASAKFYRYRLLFTSPDGMSVVPANTSTSTNATSIRSTNQEPINPFGPIYYYSTTAAVESGTSVSSSYAWLQYSAIGFGYSFNRTSKALTMTPKAPIYIKCAPQPDGSAIMDGGDNPYVQELPSTEDGKIYIYLGIAESATACTLYNYHPVYYYKDGAIRLWTNTPEEVIDTAMSSSSTNAVQNKVIKEYIDEAISSVTINIDSDLDTGSTNPVANSAVTNAIYEIDEVTAAALNDLNERKADKEYVDEAVSSITIDVDSEMDSASTNPVQNKVVKEYIDNAISSITIDVDTELDSGSTNPVANSAITSYLTDAEYVISQAFNDLELRKADKSYVDEAVSSITIDVDSELDSGSTNPVENRAIWSELDEMGLVIGQAINDLESRKADKNYVDEAISAITIDVDEEVDSASTNPVENRAIYEYIAEIEEVVSSSLNDLNDRKADKSYVDSAVSSITIDVDTNLDSASTNPVENRVIYRSIADIEEIAGAALNDLNRRKADKSYVDDAVSSITIDVDTEMDSGSTNPVANSAVTKTILDNERVIAAAFNNLNDRMTGVESGLTTQLSSGSTDDEYPSAKATYDEIHPKVESSMPSGGLHPNVFYNLGTLTGNVTISFATPFDSSVENEYRFRFTAGATAPTITWPSSITKWAGNCIDTLTMQPTITAGNVYEVSVLDGLAIIIEYV